MSTAALALPSATQPFAVAPPVRAAARRDKLNVAVIGCGGKGDSDLAAMKDENVVALCDVDAARAAKGFARHPDVRKYDDWRELLDRERHLGAVVIATPDHTHAVIAVAAMQRKLHVFCQKPLTRTVEEARPLRLLAAESGVVTQMGNQGTSMEGVRRTVEIVRSGVLGAIREAHVWTDRPIWPQGIARPAEIEPIPATFRWDLWLGPAKHRPYNKAYAPFAWRGWWDFGTGALGDMACHTMNMAFWSLELGAPLAVEAEHGDMTDDSPPKWSIVRYDYPARGAWPPLRLTWYDGGKRPPADVFPEGTLQNGEVAPFGTLIVGEKGALFSPTHYGEKFTLLPETAFADVTLPEPSLPRSPGIHEEWLAACKGGPQPCSSFAHAARFTESVLLGNVAIRAGERIAWDDERMLVTNSERANRYLRGEYAYGYSIGT